MTHTPGPWKIAEENVGGGFNIYAGPLRIAHTAIQPRAFTPDGRTIDDAEAKANACLIVEAVNKYLAHPGADAEPPTSQADNCGDAVGRTAGSIPATGATYFIERCKSYLEDAPAHGGHSDAAGATAFELIEEAIEWIAFPNSPTETAR